MVVVIIGILAAMGIAQFKDSQKKAQNAQRIVAITAHINALKRMNASGENFPITTGQGKLPHTHIVCLMNDDCWNNEHKTSATVKAAFAKHLQGIDEYQKIKSNTEDRTGIIYQYPLPPISHSSASVNGFTNYDKTLRMDWVMHGGDYKCETIDGGISFANNYTGADQTYCVIYMEDQLK